MLPFERLKAAEKIEGTGLGLPLAKMLTELHDGVLDLSSMPGRGTRVTIHLPPYRVLADLEPANKAEPLRASCQRRGRGGGPRRRSTTAARRWRHLPPPF